MLQVEKDNQIRIKIQDKLNLIVSNFNWYFIQQDSINQTIKVSEDKINKWNNELKIKQKEKTKLETEIELNGRLSSTNQLL